MLAGICRSALDQLLADQATVEPVGRHQLIVGAAFDDPAAVEHHDDATIPQLFAEQVAARPDAPAVVSDEGSLTYAELDARSSRLARHLQRLGLGPETPVGRFLAKRGPGLHHIALAVPDLDETLAELTGAGVRLVDETPRIGAEGHRIAFVHPASFGGVLVELCER